MLKAITVQSVMLLLIFGAIGAIKVKAADAQRNYPSIFQAWNGIENKPDADELHRLVQHDLAFAHPYTLLKVTWDISEAQPYPGLATALNPSQLDAARQRKQELLSLNPNLLLLVEIRYRDARYVSRKNEASVENWWEVGYLPPDSPYWLRDNNGNPVINAIPVPDHLHNWYDFYDADLGQPTQDRAVQYRDVIGLFIREFEKGWAVYNRSGAERTVTFDEPVIGVSNSKRHSHHEIPDFDGEIFLKTDED